MRETNGAPTSIGFFDYLEVGLSVENGTYAKKPDAADIYVIADQFSTDLERLITDPKEPPTPTPVPATPIPAVTPTPAGTPAPGP